MVYLRTMQRTLLGLLGHQPHPHLNLLLDEVGHTLHAIHILQLHGVLYLQGSPSIHPEDG